MNKIISEVIFTFIWLAFILILCIIWNSANPLWLLILYVAMIDYIHE